MSYVPHHSYGKKSLRKVTMAGVFATPAYT